ncbi:hypothetical protein Dsin_031868 [Dipteronia sinensis]|uniref:25S rRNA (uridine-N(3))-methyltransferase BMT5-like domain-containing protein n=1 Tax=Dipteronia sinensis TaxID=43782 RepID=A0AAD9ZMH7_9ROSI|nr:hypothetical protein Dsin_031868 [Dipteronia sinensis]
MTRTRTRRKKVKWIKHYNNRQKILLVGEGDFSFSSCLANAFGSATNMVATCFHSEDVQITKHLTCIPHLKLLERKGCTVLSEVDVHDMNHHPTLYYMKFDVIIFNFPHAGHYDHLCERDDELIQISWIVEEEILKVIVMGTALGFVLKGKQVKGGRSYFQSDLKAKGWWEENGEVPERHLKFYNGKSKSFTSLAEASSASSGTFAIPPLKQGIFAKNPKNNDKDKEKESEMDQALQQPPEDFACRRKRFFIFFLFS